MRKYLIALRNILLGGNLITLQLIGKPKEFVSVISTLLFHFKTLTGKGRLIQQNPTQIFTSTKKYEIMVDTDYYFWGSDSSYTKDIVTLCIITKIISPNKIFEIGTLDGYTAYHFAMNSNENTQVFTLDLPIGIDVKPILKCTDIDKIHQLAHTKVTKYRFQNTEYENKICCLFGDSAKFNFELYYNEIDLFFIDGAHSYEYVKSDTENALKCVRKGGAIIWHDYGRMGVNGVAKLLHEMNSKGYEIYSVPGSSLAYHMVK